MADVDEKLIGQVLNSIPYETVFGAPLSAAVDTQTKACNSALNFILNVGFSEDENGVKKTNYAEFEFEEDNGDGSKVTRKLRVPLLLLVNSPQLMITEGVISFDVEISQSAEIKDHVAAEGEAAAQIGWGPFSASFKAKASYGRESTRKTDTRAKQHVELTMKQAEPPEAFNVMMEIMREAALGARTGTSQKALEEKTVTPTPAPAPTPSKKPDTPVS